MFESVKKRDRRFEKVKRFLFFIVVCEMKESLV